MTATGDDDGGMAVWPVHLGAVSGAQEFVATRPSSCPPSREHRVFTLRRAVAMLRFVHVVQDTVRQVEGGPDDARGLMRQRFLGAIMQAEAHYRHATDEDDMEPTWAVEENGELYGPMTRAAADELSSFIGGHVLPLQASPLTTIEEDAHA